MNTIRKDYFNNLKPKATREGFGEGLFEIGKDERVFALCADLTESVKMDSFKKAYTERFVEMGVAEQNMASVASGLAAMGMMPYMASYATFSPGRNWEQIRTTICYNNVPVRIIGAHSGLMTGPDGGTHQMLEDIALMRALPNMAVLVPADAVEAKAMTIESLNIKGPVYIRLTREKDNTIFDEDYVYSSKPQIIYKNDVKSPTHKVAIVSVGPIIREALYAAKDLAKEGVAVDVINCSTIKPLDHHTIKRIAEVYNKLIVLEEHQQSGGLYSAVCESLAQSRPTKVLPVCIDNRFGQSGTYEELWKEYKIDRESVKEAIYKILAV